MLIFSIIFSTFGYQKVSANEKPTYKHNFIFISTSYDNIEYTYEENGNCYKVIERISEDLKQIQTEVYQKTDFGEYICIQNYTTMIQTKNNGIELKILEDEKQTTKFLDLESLVQNYDLKTRPDMKISSYGEWEFVDRHNGSTGFQNFTYGVVVAILVNIVSGGFGVVGSAVVGTIAGAIVSERIPVLYYDRMVFYYREGPALVTKVQVSTTFYYDENHQHYFNGTTQIFEGTFPW